MTERDAIDDARRRIDEASRVVVLTGAGISTESGIPDFRGPRGVWTRNPAAEKQSTIQNYLAEPEVRKTAWRARVDSPAWAAEPNAGHRALVALERRGKLHALVTQNIDELHQRAGEDDPPCPDCGGIQKSDTISFGQALVADVIDRALRAASEADVLLAIGTTLQVQPVAGMVPIAARAGADIIIVNDQPTAMDALADIVLRAQIGAVLTEICGRPSASNGG